MCNKSLLFHACSSGMLTLAGLVGLTDLYGQLPMCNNLQTFPPTACGTKTDCMLPTTQNTCPNYCVKQQNASPACSKGTSSQRCVNQLNTPCTSTYYCTFLPPPPTGGQGICYCNTTQPVLGSDGNPITSTVTAGQLQSCNQPG